MKAFHKICLAFIQILYVLSVSAQSDAAKINFIKVQFAEINKNIKSYKKIIKEDTVETTEGNEILEYFKGNQIKKISTTYYSEMGKNLEEYYFFDKKLIFYYSLEIHYKKPFYLTHGEVLIAYKNEKRYYFYDGKIFLVKLNPKQTVTTTGILKLSIGTEKEANRLLHLQ